MAECGCAVDRTHLPQGADVDVGALPMEESHFVENAQRRVAGQAIGSKADIDSTCKHFGESVLLMAKERRRAWAVDDVMGRALEGQEFLVVDIIHVCQQDGAFGQVESQELRQGSAMGVAAAHGGDVSGGEELCPFARAVLDIVLFGLGLGQVGCQGQILLGGQAGGHFVKGLARGIQRVRREANVVEVVALEAGQAAAQSVLGLLELVADVHYLEEACSTNGLRRLRPRLIPDRADVAYGRNAGSETLGAALCGDGCSGFGPFGAQSQQSVDPIGEAAPARRPAPQTG